MKKDYSGWIIGGLFLIFFATLYLFNSYDNIFERRLAYLYDPDSDDIYRIEMAPVLNRYRKWDVFNPFTSLTYVEPDYAEYVGKLHTIITEFKADIELLDNDFEALSEKHDQEMDELMSEMSNNEFEIEFWDIEYYIRSDKNVQSYMSEVLANTFNDHKSELEQIRVVDAVIAHHSMSDDGSFSDSSTINIFNETLLFRGEAARILSRQGLY